MRDDTHTDGWHTGLCQTVGSWGTQSTALRCIWQQCLGQREAWQACSVPSLSGIERSVAHKHPGSKPGPLFRWIFSLSFLSIWCFVYLPRVSAPITSCAIRDILGQAKHCLVSYTASKTVLRWLWKNTGIRQAHVSLPWPVFQFLTLSCYAAS